MEHRSYNGEATWDDFPCVSANEKEKKKKERKRELGKFNSCHLKLKLEIKQGIHLKILKFKHM